MTLCTTVFFIVIAATSTRNLVREVLALMQRQIRDVLKNKKIYDAESQFLHSRIVDCKTNFTIAQKKRMLFLDEQLTCIQTWLALLTEDEAYVVTRHIIDGVDIPRITLEYQKRWGDEYTKTERTIKTYQRKALAKIEKFEQIKQMWNNADKPTS